MKPRIFIGTSGWNYDHWKNIFYHKNCPKSKWLEFYARYFRTVEVNATFYRLPKPSTFENWHHRTPEDFLWAVKASRYITHVKRLNDAEDSLDCLFDAARMLREKLGPVLFQLPPTLAFDEGVADQFFRCLHTFGHPCALEVRHPSWIDGNALVLLQRYNIALCISDTAGRYPYSEAVPASFIMAFSHGDNGVWDSALTVWPGFISPCLCLRQWV